MMKHIKLLAIAFVSMLALASCNTDQEGPLYTPMSENISLSQKTQSYTTDQATIDIPVRFVRSDAKSEYTAHYTLDTKTAENFSDPNNGQVTFKAGEGVAVVTLKAQNMQKGSSYSATLKLSDEDAAKVDTITNTALLSSTISVMCDYEWEDAGTVLFTDGFFGAPETEVKLQHAVSTDINLYKLVNPYSTIYGEDMEDGDIKFYVDDNFNAKSIDAGTLFSGSGYSGYYNPANATYANYCDGFRNEGDTFLIGILLLEDGSPVSYGDIAFKWTNWPGNK